MAKTREMDLVLIHFEDTPVSFARVERIEPDRKPGWYHVTLLMLQVPVHIVTWILRDVYINGDEFTMGGKRVRLERVAPPALDHAGKDAPQRDGRPGPDGAGSVVPSRSPESTARGKVISLKDRQK